MCWGQGGKKSDRREGRCDADNCIPLSSGNSEKWNKETVIIYQLSLGSDGNHAANSGDFFGSLSSS